MSRFLPVLFAAVLLSLPVSLAMAGSADAAVMVHHRKPVRHVVHHVAVRHAVIHPKPAS
jgi:hypothetical protein